MKIEIPYENGMVFQHFGHTAEFKFYEVENGQKADICPTFVHQR